jgi:hypothetical protein
MAAQEKNDLSVKIGNLGRRSSDIWQFSNEQNEFLIYSINYDRIS